MNRGDVYWINLEPATPPESGKVRPGVVISASDHNRVLSTVVIVPISPRPPEIWPLRVALGMPIKGKKPGFAILPGIRQVSKTRLLEPIGAAPSVLIANLDDALQAYLMER